MQPLAARWDEKGVDDSAFAFWRVRGMVDEGGGFGPASGSVTHQFLGTVLPSEPPFAVWQRTIVGDSLARALAMARLRSRTSIMTVPPRDSPGPGGEAVYRGLRVQSTRFGAEDRERVQGLLERLASRMVLTTRSAPLRTCLGCRAIAAPESIVYSEEDRASYWVRFPIDGDPLGTRVLVWTDAAWKLLGTSAVGFDPKSPYSIVRLHRRGGDEVLALAPRALPAVGELFPDATWEVLEERPAATWAGLRYRHPLAVAFPALGDLPPPAGGLIPVEEVQPRGTGFVAITPSHGFADAVIAQRVQLPGWPVVGPDGLVDASFRTAYARLPLAVADSFALRDLVDGGGIFASVVTSRGVPRCAICGGEIVWIPGRTWVLEPTRLSADTRRWISQLLPRMALPAVGSGLPWPVASLPVAEGTDAALLLECSACERLVAPTGGDRCTCGGRLTATHRLLLPGFREALAQTARQKPYLPGDAIRLVLPLRHAAPAATHFLAALEASDAAPGSVSLLPIPTVGPGTAPGSDAKLVVSDAMRLSVAGLSASPREPSTLANGADRKGHHVTRLWTLGRELIAASLAHDFTPDLAPLTTVRADLVPEDRSIISVFERLRADVLRAYEAGDLASAVRLLVDYVDGDLSDAYRLWIAPRIRGATSVTDALSGLRTLWHVVPLLCDLHAPVAPATSEEMHRAFRGDRQSVFAGGFAPLSEGLLDPAAEPRLVQWLVLARALERARRRWGVPDALPLPEVVLETPDEAAIRELQTNAESLPRVTRASKVNVVSTNHPFDRYQLLAVPVLPEIQKAYGAQAPRIARVLSSMEPSRVRDGLRTQNLSVVLDGQPASIRPPMVAVDATLPKDWAAEPSELGTVFLRVPEGSANPPAKGWPALSAEGQRVVRALLDATDTRSHAPRPGPVRLLATGELKLELEKHQKSLEAFLRSSSLEVGDIAAPTLEVFTVRGRTVSGFPWAIEFPAIPRPPTPRRSAVGSGRGRWARLEAEAAEMPEGTDYLAPEVRDRDTQLREISRKLDNALGTPLIGPAKLSYAWDAGLRDYDSFTKASYEKLEPIPGFGPTVAATIVATFGGTVPAKPPRIPPHQDSMGRDMEPAPDARVTAAVPSSEATPAPSHTNASPREGQRRDAAALAGGAMVVAAATISREVEPPTPPSPPEGGVELSIDASDQAWQRFLEAASAGHHGLCISREFPDRIRSRIGPRAVDILWLSNAGRENSLRPTDVDGLKEAVVRSVEDRATTVVLIAGVEYLLLLHPTEAMVALLRELDALAVARGVRIWVPVESGLTDTAKLSALEAGFAAG